MDPFWQFIIGMTLAIILHELTHLLTIIYYKIPFKAIVLTKCSAVGFLIFFIHVYYYINLIV